MSSQGIRALKKAQEENSSNEILQQGDSQGILKYLLKGEDSSRVIHQSTTNNSGLDCLQDVQKWQDHHSLQKITEHQPQSPRQS